MPSMIPAAKRRRSRTLRSAALLSLYSVGLLLIALAFFAMVGR